MEEAYLKLLEQILRERDKLVLDCGCADGRLVSTLAKKHPQKYFIGYDPDVDILRTAKKGSAQSASFKE